MLQMLQKLLQAGHQRQALEEVLHTEAVRRTEVLVGHIEEAVHFQGMLRIVALVEVPRIEGRRTEADIHPGEEAKP